MLSVEEMKKITKLLYKAHKNQLLTIVQHIEHFPLKNKMTSAEYVEYINEVRYKRNTKIYAQRKSQNGEEYFIEELLNKEGD